MVSLEKRTPQNYTTANFGHPVSKSWLGPCIKDLARTGPDKRSSLFWTGRNFGIAFFDRHFRNPVQKGTDYVNKM